MKKLLLIAGLMLSLVSAVEANASELPHATFVPFDFNKAGYDYFFCTVTSISVTQVLMKNHSAMIAGFDMNGEMEFRGPAASTLINQVYFTAIPDQKKNSSPFVVIEYNGDGINYVQCQSGKGDRIPAFGYGLTH